MENPESSALSSKVICSMHVGPITEHGQCLFHKNCSSDPVRHCQFCCISRGASGLWVLLALPELSVTYSCFYLLALNIQLTGSKVCASVSAAEVPGRVSSASLACLHVEYCGSRQYNKEFCKDPREGSDAGVLHLLLNDLFFLFVSLELQFLRI